jgi:DNA-binding LacI/PurR family transcriptional regulator
VRDIAGRVDALVTFAGTVPAEAMGRIARRIPVLEITQEARHADVHTVTVENERGMRELTEHLIGVHGHRSIAFLGSLETGEFLARYEGYRAAMADHGLEPGAPLGGRPGMPGETLAIVLRLLESPLPQAIVCSSDQEAVVVLAALARHGVAVPDDVAVTGFDGILAGRLAVPALTTVQQPMEQIGRRAVQIVSDVLAGRSSGTTHARLPVELAIRRSCGCP